MTIAEAIQAERDKHHDAMDTRRVLQTLAAQGIMFGTDAAAGMAGRLSTRGLLHGGTPLPLVKRNPFDIDVRSLAALEGLDVRSNIIPGKPNASFAPRIAAMLNGLDSGRHGSINLHGRGIRSMPADVAAHEVGHALAWNGKAGAPAELLAKTRMPAQVLAFLAPLIGGTIATTGRKSLADRDKWFDRTSLASGLGAGVVATDEALASRNALKVLEKLPMGLRERALENAGPRLLRAWASYGLGGLGLVLGPQLAKHYYHKAK